MLSELHVTFLFVALLGITIATNATVSPISSSSLGIFNDTFSTFITSGSGSGSGSSFGNTVISHTAVLFPSTVVTVIFAFPSPTALTTPLFTVATFVLSELHVTFLFVALLGVIVATNVTVSPIFNSSFCEFNVTFSTFITSGSGSSSGKTVISHVAVLFPSTVVTVIFAFPSPTAVTTPFSTVAASVLSDFHVTDLFVALSGVIVAINVVCSPTLNSPVCEFKDTLSTLITSGSGVGSSGISIESPPTDNKFDS